MDALKYQYRLKEEEADKWRKEHHDLFQKFTELAEKFELLELQLERSEDEKKVLEKKLRYAAVKSVALEEVAKTPLLFDMIIKKMDRASQYKMMRTNHLMRNVMVTMGKKKVNPLNPLSDVTVKIEKAMWDFGFTSVHFDCYLTSAISKGKTDVVSYRKMETGRRVFMSKNDFKMSLRGMQPKEFVFDFAQIKNRQIIPNVDFFAKHESFFKELKPAQGTKTTIKCGNEDTILDILDLLKPKTLTLFKPRVDMPDLLKSRQFETVENLRITELDTGVMPFVLPRDHTLDLSNLINQLVFFEIDGDYNTFPSLQVNSLIKAWVDGDSKLRKINAIIQENEVEQVVNDVLVEMASTPIKYSLIPREIRQLINKEVAGNDIDTDAFKYRLLLSPPKKQMGCVYYCPSLKTPFSNKRHSHFGFVAVDFYPEKKYF